MPQGRHHKEATTWRQSSIFMALLELLSSIKGRLTCICSTLNPLIPADHGLMGEERSSFNPEASAQGWQRLPAG